VSSAAAAASPRATVLVPTHDRTRSLQLAVRSALAQTEPDLEVIVIGDGVTDRARRAIEELLDDARVRFLDRPKSEHHGEPYRHEAIVAARSDAIFYLCDDDLLLPDHVADLLGLLDDHDFVQCRNGCVNPAGAVELYPGDLATSDDVEWMLQDAVAFNFVSLTGTAHRRSYYTKCAQPWDTTPPGVYPDHHQWRRMFRAVPPRAATSHRMTVLQFPTSTHGRERWSDADRLAELDRWAAVVVGDDVQTLVDHLVAVAAWRLASRETVALSRTRFELADLQRTFERSSVEHRVALDALRTELARASAEHRVALDTLRQELARESEERQAMRQTVSWRITAPLRAVRQRHADRRDRRR
jgi:hypothetical protein